ncbi:MAG: sulfatase-like hydrolase/transferase [Lachnospiraceae bacterium]|nr:sulfatase-like hydrolase/transferase [Lachnospiraceae bacterium]
MKLLRPGFIESVKYFLLTIVLTFLYICLCFPSEFQVHTLNTQETTVSIKPLSLSIPLSKGNDIAISKVLINENEVNLSAVPPDAVWSYSKGALRLTNPQSTQSLDYQAPSMEKISITFFQSNASGLLLMIVNGKPVDIINLYSNRAKSYTWSFFPESYITPFSSPILLAILFYLIGNSLDCLRTIALSYNNLTSQKRHVLLHIITWLAICFCISYVLYIFNIGLFSSIRQDIYFFFFCSGLLFLVFGICVKGIFISNAQSQSLLIKPNTINYIVLFIIPGLAFLIVEQMSGNSVRAMDYIYWGKNYLLYFFVILILSIPARSLKRVTVVFLVLCGLYGIVNYFIILFRGSPLCLTDFLSWKTAINVSASYDYILTLPVIKGIYLLLLIIFSVVNLFASNSDYGNYRQHNNDFGKYSVIRLVIAFIMTSLFLTTSFFKVPLSYWDYQEDLQNYGTLLYFVAEAKASYVSKPEGYSFDNLNDIAQKYPVPESTKQNLPNIIVIMNESFSDLRVISNFATSAPFLTNYESLKGNVLKGDVYVPVFGGRTCNSEFEFLTGNTMALLPKNTIPFQQYIKENTFSLPGLLKSQGYYTVGIHPYLGDSWKRNVVYPLLGFDKFLDIESFNSNDISRGNFLSDRASYEKIIEVFEDISAQKQPAFIFNVTMQNHGGYRSNAFLPEDLVRITEVPGVYPEAEEYLTLIKESDNAFVPLLDYFKNCQEPVIILFFGDHQPKLGDGFYDYLYQKNSESSLENEIQSKYKTPFFIWANFKLSDTGYTETSLNFLYLLLLKNSGLLNTPYTEFLNCLYSRYPVITQYGVKSHSSDSWIELDVDSDLILKEYSYVQYNNMFDNNKILDFYQ